MYASVVAWTFRPDTEHEVRRVYRDVLTPIAKRQPGFRHCYIVRTGTDAWLVVVTFDTKADQEAAFAILNPLIRLHQGRSIQGMRRYAGEVEIDEAVS